MSDGSISQDEIDALLSGELHRLLLQVQAMIWPVLKKQPYFNLQKKTSPGCLRTWSP